MIAGVRRPAAERRISAARAKFAFYVVLVFACYILARFFFVQIREGPALARRAYDEHLTTLELPARRGTIYDRDGNVLVSSLPSQSVYVSPEEIVDRGATAQKLAAVLDLRAADVLSVLASKSEYIQLDHKISREQADRLLDLALPGVSVVPEPTGTRFIPSGRLASTVLGFTGFNENGLDGIEYEFDSLLRGTPGRMALESDQFGRVLPFARPRVELAARPGYSLVLTLDSYLQYNVEQILQKTVAQWHGQSGSALVMDPHTGAILALANFPDFDARDYWRYSADDLRDRAIDDAYEPGSTFKLVTAAAALDSGNVSPQTRFPNVTTLTIAGSTIHNADDGFAPPGPSETLGTIITQSLNVGAAEVGLRIGAKTMDDAVLRYGFGSPTGVDLPGESPGIVPPLRTWSATTLPTLAFGQGIATTALAMARLYCAIANGGVLVRPRIVQAIRDPSGTTVYQYGREIERRVMSARTAAILQGYLRDVVVRGTGNPTAQVPGYTTAGKTGTAQVAENGIYMPGAYVASFIGYIPADAPRFLVLVKVTKPQGSIYGSAVAAPAFAQIARLAMMHAGVLPHIAPRLVPAKEPAKSRA